MSLSLPFWIAIFIISLAGLVFSADRFTESAEKIGRAFGLSSFIVGATIVSIGSSLPEVATSLMAIVNGGSTGTSFPIENVLGSNIANCLMVGGITAISVGTLSVKNRLIDVDLPFFFLSSALFLLFLRDGNFTASEGVLSLILLGIFIAYTIYAGDGEKHLFHPSEKKPPITIMTIVILIAGAVGIYFSAEYTILSIETIAELLSIESAVLTMIAVAVGTSLPELVVSVRAAQAGKHSLALGNIFGSNTFNVLAVTGISSFFATLTVSPTALSVGIPFFLVSTLGFIFITHDDRIQKWEGWAMLVVYAAFCGSLMGILS